MIGMLVMISLSNFMFGQTDKSLIINTWKAVKFEEASGEQFHPPVEMKNDYLKFNSNGTYESLEYGQLMIKGTWSYNSENNTLILKQSQIKEYPSQIVSKIIKLTKTELVLESKDMEGNKLIVYSVPK